MKKVLADHESFVQTVQADDGFKKWAEGVSPEVAGIRKVWLKEFFLVLQLLWEVYQILRKNGFIKFWWETRKVRRALTKMVIVEQEKALISIRDGLIVEAVERRNFGFFFLFGLAVIVSPARAQSLDEEVFGNGIYTTAQKNDAEGKTAALKKAWEREGIRRVAIDVDKALGQLMKISIINLRRRGYHKDANYIASGWKKLEGTLPRIAVLEDRSRKIGDWEPLSAFLSTAYDKLESVLGYDLCKTMHLYLIKSFNYGIPVVILKTCEYGEQEFFFHFVSDDPLVAQPYQGLAPATAFLLAQIGCSIGTFGMGAIAYPICGAVSQLCELAVEKWVAPYLAPKIYAWACTK